LEKFNVIEDFEFTCPEESRRDKDNDYTEFAKILSYRIGRGVRG